MLLSSTQHTKRCVQKHTFWCVTWTPWLVSFHPDRPVSISYCEERSVSQCATRHNAILLEFISLEEVINSHNLDFMIYADETQLDIQPGEDCANPLAKLELCTRDVITWCANIALICNPGKTEVVHFSSRFSKDGIIAKHRSKWNYSSIHLFSLQFSFCFR